MSDPVTLLVPVEERYRVLAPELARKYVEIAGGSAGDGQVLAEAVQQALTQMAAGLPADADMHLAFRLENSGVEIQIRSGARVEIVTHSLADRKLS